MLVTTRETQNAQTRQKDAETANGLNTDLSGTIRFDGITLRDLRDQRDLRRLVDATPMPESVEVLDRPRFQQ